MEDLKKCQLNSSSCGIYSAYRNENVCVILKELEDDCSKAFSADILLTECDLISLRSTVSLDPDGFICPKHRFSLGKEYKPIKGCSYLEHPKNSKAKGMKISWPLYKYVKSCDSSFVLGCVICKPCQMKLNKERSEEPMDIDESDMEINNDPDFIPFESFVDENEKFNRRVELDALANMLGVERVRFQVNTDIDNLSSSSITYFRNMHSEMQKKLTEKFCYLTAPGQEHEMNKYMKVREGPENDQILMHLKEAFDTCTTIQARRSVLMLIPKSYSKQKVCEIFDCSFYEVEKARSVLKSYGTCAIEPKRDQVYSRLSIERAKHFINFLFSSGILHEVAYGTTKLKFDSGNKLDISNTILNGIREHAVKQYIIYCKEMGYHPLGRSTLLNILDKMKAHTRKKLAGIDTFVVEGVEAFESLKRCVKLLDISSEKQLLKSINEGENYLKTRYKFHCKTDDSCISHCIDYALSHPKDKELFSGCKKTHVGICEECLSLVSCIALLKVKLSRLPPSHEKDVAEYDVNNAESKILEWQRHLLRGVQQSKARSNALEGLSSTKALWLRDFAQKYNPTKTLESMNEYFGKRGISVSVEVFITKVFQTYHKQVYLVGLDRSDQDLLETLCIADTVLDEFSKDYPNIKELQVKSDNAGNYHGNGVPECMFKFGKEKGILITSYNYNEAQLGKDQCDREAAIFKMRAERWLLRNETNKITTARELLDAVFSDGGPKNTKMCTLKINKEQASLTGVRNIANISYYHTIEFQETGALYKEYYNIGVGKFHDYSDLTFVNGASSVNWRTSDRQQEPMSYDSRNKEEYFNCPEMLCISQFQNESDLMSHVSTGSHQFPKIKSAMDKAILYYAQQKNVQNILLESTLECEQSNVAANDSNTNLYHGIYFQGWARKVRRVGRLSSKQKEFIAKLFHNGATSKSKLSAEQMTERMKNEIIDGRYYFRPEEYLQTSQIRSLISRLKKQQNNPLTNVLSVSEDDGIVENLEDICDSVINSDTEDFEGFEPCDI